jgi:hypothetical protein
VHGRKGIGKLAAFGTAGILECITLRAEKTTMFRLDYDQIRKLHPDQDYPVDEVSEIVALIDPDSGQQLKHGTRVRLTKLWLKRALAEAQFTQSMSRRFALSQNDMKVFINGVPLGRFNIPVQFRFPKDGVPTSDTAITVDPDGWARETLEDDSEVRWWIGFTEEPLDDESLQGISVLARGKMAQRPFKFDRARGTTGQLGQEYLVGEVQADWLDKGVDIEDDLIQSNRDQLQLEDERLDLFIEWGRRRLGWALRRRNDLRQEYVLKEVETGVELDDILSEFTTSEKNNYLKIAKTFSKIPEVKPESVRELMEDVVNARSDVAVRGLMEQIQLQDDPIQSEMWKLVHQFGLIDARRLYSIIRARLETIRRLKEALESGAKEVPEIHNVIARDTWLLDPRWDLLDHEVKVETLGVAYAPEQDENGQQIDFLFVLQPRPPATVDEVVVVEIKRGTNPNGSIRKATDKEVDKFAGYVLSIHEHYSKSTNPPPVRGLMVAQDYTPIGNQKRKYYEQGTNPRMRFKTWTRVVDETERMHLGWLEVSRRRGVEPVSDGAAEPE